MTGSELYHRTIAIYEEQSEERDLMHLLWGGTPWMVDAYIGPTGEERHDAMRQWCRNRYGPEASPIGCHAGAWFGGYNMYSGSSTFNGWAWFGFAAETMMTRFQDAWPMLDDAPPLPELL